MASSPDAPTPVDPNTVIQAQEKANRVGKITPFGSQKYDSDGNLVTSLPEGTQTAFNNVSEMGGNKQQFIQAPTGAAGLQDAIMGKIAARYQTPSQGAKPAQQNMSSPGMMNQQGAPSSQAWQSALSQIWGNHQ